MDSINAPKLICWLTPEVNHFTPLQNVCVPRGTTMEAGRRDLDPGDLGGLGCGSSNALGGGLELHRDGVALQDPGMGKGLPHRQPL